MKNIVVTGSSKGIGYAVAKRLAESNDFQVIGTSRSGSSPLNNPHYTCLPLSLESEESIIQFATSLAKVSPVIHGLINNAGILLDTAHDSALDRETLRKTLDVNLIGTISLTEHLLPKLSEQSHIINLTSNWGSFSDQHFDDMYPHYKLSKAALNMYSKMLGTRLKKKCITVSALDPGWVKTDMGGMNADKEPEEVAAEVLAILENKSHPSGYFWRDGKERQW